MHKLNSLKYLAIFTVASFLITGCSLNNDGTTGNPFFDANSTTTANASADAAAAAAAETAANEAAAAAAAQTAARAAEAQAAERQAAAESSSSSNDSSSNSEPSPAPSESNTAAVSSTGNAVGGGFVWKPVSEGDGNLVVLTPASVNANVMSISGSFGSENGRYTGRTNGNRATFRFSRPGCGYGNNISVNTNGGASYFIPAGCNRVDL